MKKLKLYSIGLLSKWGFNDGEEIKYYMDSVIDEYYDANPQMSDRSILEYFDWWYSRNFVIASSDNILSEIVQMYMIPKLKKNHSIEDNDLVDMGGSHNQTRLNKIDGKSIDWYTADQPNYNLNPEYVELTYDEFRKVLSDHFGISSGTK